jgi:hypothetical protein
MTKEKQITVGESLNEIVLGVISQKHINGFQKAYIVSDGISKLKQLLTPEYMKPIMELQGTKLGFKTDKDIIKNPNGHGDIKGPGYPEEVVKICLIEAVFFGLQPYGNQFNIIGGNMYPTKEGLEYKLNTWEGLKYYIFPGIPSVNAEKTSALFNNVRIKWTYQGETLQETIEIPLKVAQYTSVDAMQGKAKRKAMAWLLSVISGESVTDGDVSDISYQEVKDTAPKMITEAQKAIIKERISKLGTRIETQYNEYISNYENMTHEEAIGAINYLNTLK